MTEPGKNNKNTNLIWLDLEMTGLDPEKDLIIEIATVVTDKDLNVIAEGPVLAIHQSDEILGNMDKWCTKQHAKSGLVERVQQSQISEAFAEQQTIDFLQQFIDKGKSPMCGNTICQDRRFLYRYMPKLVEYFHYRNVDVSTIKELLKRWQKGFKEPKKKMTHLALDDVYESIAELRHYREQFFNLSDLGDLS